MIYIDREDRQATLTFWRFSIMFFWHTDMLEILPNVHLCYGYIKGIFEGEIVFQVSWLTFSFQIVFSTK